MKNERMDDLLELLMHCEVASAMFSSFLALFLEEDPDMLAFLRAANQIQQQHRLIFEWIQTQVKKEGGFYGYGHTSNDSIKTSPTH